ncbi:MAG: C13 family peptidase [Gemmatimonadaceae bacterium]
MMRVRLAKKWLRAASAVGAFLLLGGAPRANAQQPPSTWVLVVSGSSGEPRFATAFLQLGSTFLDAVTQHFGVPSGHVQWLAEDPAADARRITGKSTKGGIDSAFARIATTAKPNDRVFVLLLGHGSAQGGPARLNIPGPDVTELDFASYLARLGTQNVVFVNAASASGSFVKSLAAKNRIILTATKSGAEGNESVFARYFVQAYTGSGADTDKDGRVSLLEAFQFARREVEREYEQDNKLLTEHAIFDDDGDGVGHADAKESDGARARMFYLAAPAGLSAQAANDPRMAPLLAKRAELEGSIDSLRQRKASMREADYQNALEDLLVKLAQTNKSIRDLQGKQP